MAARCCVIQNCSQLHVACSPYSDFARTILRRILCVGGFNDAIGFGDDAKHLLYQRECAGSLKFTSHQQNGIVWLVVLAIKVLQVFNLDVLNIGARANGALAIVVPIKSCGSHSLPQHHVGVVLAAFHFIANH